MQSSSLRPNSIAPSAAKYCAFCGTLIRSSGLAPSGIATLRSCHMRGMFACHASRMPRIKLFGPPEQQHVRPQGVAASEHAQVLQHDRFKQRRHQLIGRSADLLQAVDVGFGEHAALAGDFVQLDAVISLLARVRRGNFQLGVDLVDDRAGAAGALVVHRGDLFLAASFVVIFKDDDLGILTAEFDDRINFGCSFSTASETAVTSCTNFAPI